MQSEIIILEFMKDRSTLLIRIYRLKLFLIGALLVILGLLTSALGDWLALQEFDHLFVALVQSLADVFLVTGAIGIAVDFFTWRDKDAADTERTRSVLKELAPDFTDAVLKGLAVDKSDLERVASAELLDEIATNVLSLRLGDDQFAREIYAEVRDQAIKAPERWYDVNVDIRLSAIAESSTVGAARFDVLVKWEYTAVPSQPIQRFACFADNEDLRDFMADSPATIPWLMPASPGFDATSRDCFELLEYRLAGELQSIRRSERKAGQVYSVHLDEKVVRSKEPVRISYLYKVVANRSLHRLFIELTQPARGLTLRLDYTNTDIALMSVTDLVTSAAPVQVTELPRQADVRELAVDVNGWLLPRAGFAFVWTSESELIRSEAGATGHGAPAEASA